MEKMSEMAIIAFTHDYSFGLESKMSMDLDAPVPMLGLEDYQPVTAT